VRYTFHTDAGHGWIEVPYVELIRLGINNKISKYSYVDDLNCYLEEDCDATVWNEAYIAHYGKPPTVDEVSHRGDCFIRELNQYFPK